MRTHRSPLPPSFRSPLRAALLGLALVGAGCTSEPGSGVVTIRWTFTPGQSCTTLGIDVMRVTLGADQVVESGACSEDQIVLADLEARSYDIRVEGLDSVGDVVADNLGQPGTDERVEVLDGSSREFEVQMAPTPAAVEVRWSINLDGFQAMCSSPDVATKQFLVSVFDTTGVQPVAPQLFECDAPTLEGSTYRRIEDPDRAIRGTLLEAIRVQPLDAAGDVFGLPRDFQFTPPGAGKTVRITLVCDDNVCLGGPQPD